MNFLRHHAVHGIVDVEKLTSQN